MHGLRPSLRRSNNKNSGKRKEPSYRHPRLSPKKDFMVHPKKRGDRREYPNANNEGDGMIERLGHLPLNGGR
jgi:hypothetical protein